MAQDHTKQRLDVALVARGLVVSRARAKDLVERGEVKVAGVVARRTALQVRLDAMIELAPGAGQYVSRGALKLRPALQAFVLSPSGRIALDIGASTGGFTEVLLSGGATKVYAVDNGRDQLHPSLRADPRVNSLEATDARSLSTDLVPDPITAIVADVSFISLKKVLPSALALASPGCWLVALIKPQFELEPGRVPRTGVVADARVHAEVVASVGDWLSAIPGWRILRTMPSPVLGGDGNTEFLLGAIHDQA